VTGVATGLIQGRTGIFAEWMQEQHFDTKQHMLSPQECFQVITHNGTNTILLIPQNELIVNNKALDFTADIRTDEACDREHRSKKI
jgi:hypothetical protein